MKETLIIDYGSGNIRSVFNALNEVSHDKNIKIKVTSSANHLKNASHIILPGVGSFDTAMKNLEHFELKELLDRKALVEKVPFLGKCLGMKILTSISKTEI